MIVRLSACVLASAICWAAAPSVAQTYTIRKFDFPANAAVDGEVGLTRGGTLYAEYQDAQNNVWLLRQPAGGARVQDELGATGIVLSLGANDVGELAGTLNYPSEGAFTLRNGKLHQYKPAPFSMLRGIDNSGDIVSLAVDASDRHRYALLRPGATRRTMRYTVPGAADTYPVGTNNGFAVIGYFDTRENRSQFQGFLYQNGMTSAVTGPGQAPAQPIAINDSGVIALASGGSDYLFDGTNFTPVAVPGALGTTLGGLNNAGAAFGIYTASDQSTHGFVYKNGTYTSIDAPAGREVARLLGMDDLGNVVGTWWKGPAYPAVAFVARCSGDGC